MSAIIALQDDGNYNTLHLAQHQVDSALKKLSWKHFSFPVFGQEESLQGQLQLESTVINVLCTVMYNGQ